MNCLTARQTLDLARPGEPATAADDEAALHVRECPVCQTAVRRQQQFDARVARLCGDLRPPAGLKERLLASLEAGARTSTGVPIPTAAGGSADDGSCAPLPPVQPAAASAPRSATGRPMAVSRRRWVIKVSLAAACVVVGLGGFLFWPVRQSVSLDEIVGRVAANDLDPAKMAEMTTFGGGLVPRAPTTMRTQALVLPPRRLDDRHDVAVYFFTLSKRRGINGWLLVVPKYLVKPAELPAATSFLMTGSTTYKSGYCTTAWVEGDLVYVCCVTGNENELHPLLPPRSLST